jgi:hypothetical protein
MTADLQVLGCNAAESEKLYNLAGDGCRLADVGLCQSVRQQMPDSQKPFAAEVD